MKNTDWIYSVVDSFYEKAKTDILIGYHFRNIKDFDEHIPRIASFWELQLLGKSSRPISPPFDVMGIHLKLGIKRGEIGRWLILFRNSLNEATLEHPDMTPLREVWEKRLVEFEARFLRFLGL